MSKSKKIYEITDTQAKEVKSKNENLKLEILMLTLDDNRVFECIIKKPANASIQRYITALSVANRQNKETSQIHERFVYDNILAPTADELLNLIGKEELPLLPISIANELATGSGMSIDSKKKSL